MNGKTELSVDEIAEMGAVRRSFKGIPGATHPVGKSGLATKNPDGAAAAQAKAETLSEAAADGRVIVNPKAGVDSVMKMINEQFDETLICRKLKELLDAKKSVIDKSGAVHTTADSTTQLKALELLMKYRVGLPVQRTEVVAPATDSAANLRAKLASSPALRRAFRDTLDRLDAIDPSGPDEEGGGEDGVRPPMRRATSRIPSKFDGVQG
jgi:hypothetical protein